MTLKIKELLDTLNQLAPFELAESWDNVGLLVGNPENSVTSIIIGLDPTLDLVKEALDRKANTIITHHPVIFRPLPAITTDTPSGLLLEYALTHKLNIIASHTNFDSAVDGVNDALATAIDLEETQPLCDSTQPQVPGTGLGRIGTYPGGIPKKLFLDKLFAALELPSLQIAGQLPETITTVALCGGSGSDFAESAKTAGADVYLSAEIKHSTARWAQECDFCIVDGTHYATEKPAIGQLAAKLQSIVKKEGWGLEVLQTETERHPFTYITP